MGYVFCRATGLSQFKQKITHQKIASFWRSYWNANAEGENKQKVWIIYEKNQRKGQTVEWSDR